MEEEVTLTPEQLDTYLADGWFRMNQTVFTTHLEWLNNSICRVIWLRVRLLDFTSDNRYFKLYRKNKDFVVDFRPAVITDKHEDLFAVYKASKSFQAASSLQYLLFGEKDYNVFNSWMINIYDKETLIGSGFFDIGKDSAAGISSFYHPSYHKHSLGLFIIYQKMFFCKNLGMTYFYPGYYSPDYAVFDYKLSIGSAVLEYFDPEDKRWYPFYGQQAADQ